MEDFSIIILCKRNRHLLSQSLETLRHQQGSFEILLLDEEDGGKLLEQISHFPELKIRVQHTLAKTLAERMNEGVESSRGKYIQFLEAGDRYVSQHGLEFIATLIGDRPHLIYSGSRSGEEPSQDEFLTTRSPWFLRSKLLELGGFDERLSSCPSLDLLCRLFQQRGVEVVPCKRVLIDPAADELLSFREIYRVLLRHFGFWHAFKWIFIQDRSALFRRATSFLKEAFWKES